MTKGRSGGSERTVHSALSGSGSGAHQEPGGADDTPALGCLTSCDFFWGLTLGGSRPPCHTGIGYDLHGRLAPYGRRGLETGTHLLWRRLAPVAVR